MKGKMKGEQKKQAMTELLDLELKGLPPTVNAMYRGLHGHRYKTKEAVSYQLGVVTGLRIAWNNRPPVTDRVALFITFTAADRRRWDIDNRVKALQDCFAEAGVIKDDKQVDILHVERLYGDFNLTRIKLYLIDNLKLI